MIKKLPEYGKYRDVPPDLSYPSAWRMRGYMVKRGEHPIARLVFTLGDEKYNWPLYGLSQVRPLKGAKAKRRRAAYIAALHGYD